MAIEIKEYLGFDASPTRGGMHFTESFVLQQKQIEQEEIQFDLTEALNVDIEGVHANISTRNHTVYTREALLSSVDSWTYPYAKPLIMHHNEDDGKAIGRISSAKVIERSPLSGTPAILFNANITDKEGKEQVRDGRLLTVSVGVTAQDVRCTICGENLAENGECGHARGETYGGKVCQWEIREMVGKELSYVIVPSDPYAKNVKINNVPIENKKEEITQIKESSKVGTIKGGSINMDEKELKSLQQENADLRSKIEDIKNALKEEKKKILDIQELNTEEVDILKDRIKDRDNIIKEEKALKEALESEITEMKESEKKELVKEFIDLRKASGRKEISESAIETRSIESLKNSIEDMQSDLKESASPHVIKKVEDPTIQEEPVVKKTTKKESEDSGIDLEEGLMSIFESSARRFS